jgi:hypothetical protein
LSAVPLPGDADYVAPAQVARLLGVTPQAVRDQARRGQLPCVIRRVGATRHQYLFPRAAIEALVPTAERPRPESPSHDLSTIDLELAMARSQVAELEKQVAVLHSENAELRRELQRANRAIRVLTDSTVETGPADG